MPVLTIRVHNRTQGRATLGCAAGSGIAVQLASAEGAAAYAGVGYWRALEQELGAAILVDCEDLAGLAMAGLRAGLTRLVFTGDPIVRDKLAGMAAPLGATVAEALPSPLLALPSGADASEIDALLLRALAASW